MKSVDDLSTRIQALITGSDSLDLKTIVSEMQSIAEQAKALETHVTELTQELEMLDSLAMTEDIKGICKLSPDEITRIVSYLYVENSIKARKLLQMRRGLGVSRSVELVVHKPEMS